MLLLEDGLEAQMAQRQLEEQGAVAESSRPEEAQVRPKAVAEELVPVEDVALFRVLELEVFLEGMA